MSIKPSLTSGDVPTGVVLELTYKCNHACLFCSCPWEADRSFKKPELSTQEWKAVIDKLVSLGASAVTLSGGEPTTRPDLPELIQYLGAIKEVRYKNLVTNATLMTEDILDLLVENGFDFSTSLPGLKTYRKHTKAGSPQNVLAWIEKAHSRGLDVMTGIAVTKLNLPELFETMSYALLYGADSILLNRFVPGGRGLKHRARLELDRADINTMLDIAEQVLQSARRPGYTGTEIPYCVIDEPEKYERLTIGHLCLAAKNFFAVDPSGYVRACNHSPVRVGTLDNFTQSEYWKALRDKDYTPERCVACSKRSFCDAGCREAAHICNGTLSSDDTIFSTKTV